MNNITKIIKKAFAPDLSDEDFFKKFYPSICITDDYKIAKKKKDIKNSMTVITRFIKKWINTPLSVLDMEKDGLKKCYEYYISVKNKGNFKLIQAWNILEKITHGT